MIVFYIPFAIYGVIFCFIKYKYRKKKITACTFKVRAEVVEILTRKPWSSADLLYKPILKINYMEQEIIINTALYGGLFHFEIGQQIDIHINPQDPQEFMYGAPYSDIEKTLGIASCALPFIGMLMLFLLF